ncbi:MAG: hypothetical protein ACKVWV_07325 [Planctomycetota bacterium]
MTEHYEIEALSVHHTLIAHWPPPSSEQIKCAVDARVHDDPFAGWARLVLSYPESWNASVDADARGVAFRSSESELHVTYTGLEVWDADNRPLRARIVSALGAICLDVDDNDARYPIVIDPWIIVEEAKFVGGGGGSTVPAPVAISGARIARGRSGHVGPVANTGAVSVHRRIGTDWLAEGILLPSDGGDSDLFGYSVSIDGHWLIAGASRHSHINPSAGAAYVFHRDGSSWVEDAELLPNDSATFDAFGKSVCIQGKLAAVGSGQAGIGAVYVFERSGGVWTQQAKLVANPPGFRFGTTLTMDHDTLVVGAPEDTAVFQPGSGVVYVFVRNGSTWTQQARLFANDLSVDDYFGHSVSLDGDRLAIGAIRQGMLSGDSWGAVYIFERTGSTWTQTAKLRGSGTEVPFGVSHFGSGVGLVGDTLIVGAEQHEYNSMQGSGALYIFEHQGGVWTERTTFVASDTSAISHLGRSIAFDGSTFVASADQRFLSGAAYVFRLAWPSFCFGDGTLATPCPCAPPDLVPSPSGAPRSGCANSLDFAGARLAASGVLTPDVLSFRAQIGSAYTGYALLVKGDARSTAGIANGDGLRCVDGALIRFGAHNAGSAGERPGSWSYPNPVQSTAVSVASGQLPAQTAYYQLLYRNAVPGFCSPETLNWTNSVQVEWP